MYNKNPLDGFAPHFHIQNRSLLFMVSSLLDMKVEQKGHLAEFHCAPRIIDNELCYFWMADVILATEHLFFIICGENQMKHKDIRLPQFQL